MKYYIKHHGILGQKWGVRRYQNKDGTLTYAGKLRNKISSSNTDDAKERPHSDYNVDMWGKHADTNMLFISGISGSGKSTLARKMAKENNAELIDMDLYTYKTANKYEDAKPRRFTQFLDENYPGWRDDQARAYANLTKVNRRKSKEVAKWFDRFEDALINYGNYEFYNGKKVIAEGAQILDDTIFQDKEVFRHLPVILMETSAKDSLVARSKRDAKSIDKLLSGDRVEQLIAFELGKDTIKNVMEDWP